ncbi:MAG TPA: hypothetical protein VGR97_00220 [Candidatus Acidoferrales bacterium]|nr:hypothetical protein [Candidatus Acidoferrales bacterium]
MTRRGTPESRPFPDEAYYNVIVFSTEPRRLGPLLLLVAFLLGAALPDAARQTRPALRAQPSQQQGTASPNSASSASTEIIVHNQASPDEVKAQQDLVEMTRRLKNATWWLVAVGVLQGVVFLITLLAIKRQGDITSTQLRPWIAAEGVWLEFPQNFLKNLPIVLASSEGKSIIPFLKIKTTNTGETVAMRVAIPPAIAIAVDVRIPDINPNERDVQKLNENASRINEANERARRAALEKAKLEFRKTYGELPTMPGGWLFFPKQTRSDPMVALGDFGEQRNRTGNFEIYLVGAVNYESPLARGKFCQTGFVYQLVKRTSRDSVEKIFASMPTGGEALEFEAAWYSIWAK